MTKVEISMELAKSLRHEQYRMARIYRRDIGDGAFNNYQRQAKELHEAIEASQLKASREKTLDELAKQEKEK